MRSLRAKSYCCSAGSVEIHDIRFSVCTLEDDKLYATRSTAYQREKRQQVRCSRSHSTLDDSI